MKCIKYLPLFDGSNFSNWKYRRQHKLERENEKILRFELIDENDATEKLKKLKNRKAPGVDNTPNELVKYGGMNSQES